MHAQLALTHTRSESFQKIKAFLDSCKQISQDKNIYYQALHLMEKLESEQAETEQLLRGLISLLLSAFSLHIDTSQELLTQINSVQAKLISPLDSEKRLELQRCVELFADSVTLHDSVSTQEIAAVLEPILQSFGRLNKGIGSKDKNGAFNEQIQNVSCDSDTRECKEAMVVGAENYLKQFVSSSNISESVSQCEEYAIMLEVELAALREIGDEAEFEERKSLFVKEMEKILRQHKKMTHKLQELSNFVGTIQEDTIRLSDELDRVTLLSFTDELTQLPNRRAFQKRLNDEIGRVKRYGQKLTIALIDIDKFKPINDTYGHNAGDLVLKTYAKSVLSSFRQPDLVARYGGEEFAVIFPNTDIDGAFRALSNVHQKVNEIRVQFADKENNLPTFSAGLATYQPDEDIHDFIERVDKALYSAKKKGRNRIETVRQILENI